MLFFFVFLGQYFYLYDLFHELRLQVYDHENKDQFYTLRHCIEFDYITDFNTDCFLVNVISY